MNETIFVLSFAGGSSRSFSAWKDISSFQLVYIDMPGKGTRENELLLHHFSEMVDEGFAQIVDYLNSHKIADYCILGHSMGSYIAYQITKKMIKEKVKAPKCLFMSGSVPPQFAEYQRIESIINDECLFLQYIVEFGLVTQKIAESHFFQKRYLPQIKSDYEAMLEYRDNGDALDIPKVVFLNGKQDDLVNGHVEEWTKYFVKTPNYIWYEGSHFFILECVQTIFADIAVILKESEEK